MNAKQLAKEAALSTAPFLAAVSHEIAGKLELAYVANWLAAQDESIRAAALLTALAAIDEIHATNERLR